MPRSETASMFYRSWGFKKTGMGGNTTAWMNGKRDIRSLGAEIVIGDGSYHAPTSWERSPVTIGVTLLDSEGEPIATYERDFLSSIMFREWFLSRSGAFLRRTHPEIDSPELILAGFTVAD